jgi:hypothetical protein
MEADFGIGQKLAESIVQTRMERTSVVKQVLRYCWGMEEFREKLVRTTFS